MHKKINKISTQMSEHTETVNSHTLTNTDGRKRQNPLPSAEKTGRQRKVKSG